MTSNLKGLVKELNEIQRIDPGLETFNTIYRREVQMGKKKGDKMSEMDILVSILEAAEEE